MKHVKAGRFHSEAHLLPVGVVLVAVFWIVEFALAAYHLETVRAKKNGDRIYFCTIVSLIRTQDRVAG
ncbi:MAG TPA: hypothetical protein VK357_14060 [Rubrobacteraceae bacterium]|jgi:hypothetical protein|nr:hypothetical protein [Rubrobacteraceae bacterium]